jgi:seryl-tRNA synthetase
LEFASRTEARLQQQDKEIADLKAANKSLIDEISQKRVEIVSLTNDLNNRSAELETLESRSSEMTNQLAKLDKLMRVHGIDEDSIVSIVPPKVEAVVVGVKDSRVVIPLGTDDGLREGQSMDIYRGKRFIGKAVVRITSHSSSVLEVVPEYQQAAVMEGDHVTTKL